MPKAEELIANHLRVVRVDEVREVLREHDKKPRKEKYNVEAKVYYQKNDDGTYDYFYYRDNTKVPVVWSKEMEAFYRPKKAKKVNTSEG